jgi:hypothetical protein
VPAEPESAVAKSAAATAAAFSTETMPKQAQYFKQLFLKDTHIHTQYSETCI